MNIIYLSNESGLSSGFITRHLSPSRRSGSDFGPLYIPITRFGPTILIWKPCDGEHTVADMEQAIRANFAVTDEHDVTKDIQRTLNIFADKGLLQYAA
jgi:hypothetical protein